MAYGLVQLEDGTVALVNLGLWDDVKSSPENLNLMIMEAAKKAINATEGNEKVQVKPTNDTSSLHPVKIVRKDEPKKVEPKIEEVKPAVEPKVAAVNATKVEKKQEVKAKKVVEPAPKVEKKKAAVPKKTPAPAANKTTEAKEEKKVEKPVKVVKKAAVKNATETKNATKIVAPPLKKMKKVIKKKIEEKLEAPVQPQNVTKPTVLKKVAKAIKAAANVTKK